jgi:hypothetical protein
MRWRQVFFGERGTIGISGVGRFWVSVLVGTANIGGGLSDSIGFCAVTRLAKQFDVALGIAAAT